MGRLLRAIREHDSLPARLAVFVAALLLLFVAVAALMVWIDPGKAKKDQVIVRACFDAQELHDARLLDDARAAYQALREEYRSDEHWKDQCSREDLVVASEQVRAAAESEQGSEYADAARLGGVNGLGDARSRAESLARQAYTRSLRLYPYDKAARRDLNLLITNLGPATNRESADALCKLGLQMREAGLVPEARRLYLKALRVGRHSACTSSGLQLTRVDMAQARHALSEAQALTAADNLDGARHKYVEALTINSALVEARAALADHPGTDPREGTFMGRAQLMAEGVGDWFSDFFSTLSDNAGAIALGAVVVLLLVLLVMMIVAVLARARFVRGGLRGFPLTGRFTRPRVVLAAFAPEDAAGSTGAVFADNLTRGLIYEDADPDVGAEVVDSPQDFTESAPAPGDPLQDASTLLAALPQAGAVAATLQFFARSAPRWEVRVNGRLLDPDARGHGLRVVVATRRGRTTDSLSIWAGELPGEQLPDEPSAGARYALAIKAAAWAHHAINR